MATLKELRDERLRKLDELKALGVNAYPAKTTRTHILAEVAEKFSELEGKDATLVGRIVSIRKFARLAFIVIKDTSGSLQLFLRDGEIESLNAEHSQLGLEQINLLDSGDFVEASGQIIKLRQARYRWVLKNFVYFQNLFDQCQLRKTALQTKKSVCADAILIQILTKMCLIALFVVLSFGKQLGNFC